MVNINTSIETGLVHHHLNLVHTPHIRKVKTIAFQPKALKKPLTVGGLLKSINSTQTPAVLLGECTDKRPFLIELGEPEMSAILISGEKGSGKTHHLQVLADSALRLNSPNQLQIGVLTFKPFEWKSITNQDSFRKYSQGVFAWYDSWAEICIQRLYDLAHARREGNQSSASILLLLDNLNFIEEMSFEAQFNLRWLLEYGSQSGVWIAAAIKSELIGNHRFWTECFRTRIIGKSSSEAYSHSTIDQIGPRTSGLEPSTFRIKMRNRWMTYRLPLLGN